MDKVEFLILKCLLNDEEYARKVLPFIKEEYFEEFNQKVVFEEIKKFITEYNSNPTRETLIIDVDDRSDLNQQQYSQICNLIQNLDSISVENDWLIDTTEKWCRDRAIHLALMESVQLFDGKGEKSRDAIPSILSEALSVSFDNNIGHDYLENYQERYEYYHRKEEKVPFDLEYFDKISSGGISNKTLTVALAGTGVGKSLFMCNFASSVLLQGKNVLYITMEMAEEKIAERIDANLLDVAIQNIVDLPKSTFENKVTKLAAKTQGSLIIKEYPTASAHSGHFKSLLSDLELKKSFRPDIIFIDYLNICASSRYKSGGNVNSYSYIKSIAEELRGLAGEAKVPIVSAALISTEELEQIGQIMVKQLKNRYNDTVVNKRFVIGIDRAKMRLYDCEQSAQENILDSGQEEEYNNENCRLWNRTFCQAIIRI
jgi:replicative DNA helicase